MPLGMVWPDLRRRGLVAAATLPLLAGVLGNPAHPVQKTDKADEPTFARDVLPVLKATCLTCHGPNKAYANLRLDSYDALMKGGISEDTVVKGDPVKSNLVRRLKGLDEMPQMPKGFRPLTAEQIGKIERWIKLGAKNDGQGYVHWAYVSPERPELPAVKAKGWVRNPIDAFVLAKLEKEGFKPSKEADKATLVRRVYLDVLGMPPTPEEAKAFEDDKSPDAYEKLVDKVFASPHYGERQARIWLDLARYADSQGYEKDANRVMWPWRDWVIRAYNANMRFDEFTIEQIAGDLLPDATMDQIVATGFNRNTMINEEGGVDQGEARWLTQVDRVGTLGTVWLGTTLACAQCHNHKYDPITQKEFYQTLAYFENTEEPTISLTPKVTERLAEIQAETTKIDQNMRSADESEKEALTAQKARLVAEAGNLKEVTTLVFKRKEGMKPETPIRTKGQYLNPGEVVEADPPHVMGPQPTPGARNDRLTLARWLVSKKNTLTARVQVNRMWEQHFGYGIVKTVEDFGTQGEAPVDQPLLDWLACEFMDNGWDMKAIHRMIVMSATYRQDSRSNDHLNEVDPENRMNARGPRFRLEAEAIRDSVLKAGGLLSEKMYGPSVMPVQPTGVWDTPYNGEAWTNATGEDRYRRSVYTFIKRSSPFPMQVGFDATSREYCTPRRIRTNTPLQALEMLNDPGLLEGAVALAKSAVKASDPVGDVVEHCLIREPSETERTVLEGLRKRSVARYQKDLAAAEKLCGAKDAQLAALVVVTNAVMNTDEFLNLE